MGENSARTGALVVGAGPVGLTMAAELARHGVPCRIIDKSPSPSTTSKALAIHARTLEVFDKMGLVEKVLAAGHKIHGINLNADGRRVAHVSLDELDSPYPFVLALPQSETESCLNGQLESFGLRVEREVELKGFTQTDQEVVATLRHSNGQEETITTPWLIGCDGAHSAVRHTLGVAFDGAAIAEEWVLADVHIDPAFDEDEWNMFFHEQGLLATFAMGNGRYRLIADLPAGHHDQVSAEPTLSEIQAIATTRGPAGITLTDPVWISGFWINTRKVRHYSSGRVFLAGDAAHIHSPAGGQGMNTGIQDAHNLAWKLALTQRGSGQPALLDSYDAEREPVGKGVLNMSKMMTEMATLRRPVSQHIRNRIISILAGLEVVQNRLASRMAELVINYRHSPVVAQDWSWRIITSHSGPAAGDRAPDCVLNDGVTGKPVRLFDILHRTLHTLLLFSGNEPEPEETASLQSIRQAVECGYGAEVCVKFITAGDALPSEASSGGVFLDHNLIAHHRYGAGSACLYLIRPDGYIAYRNMPAASESLQNYLGRVFI